MKLLQPAILLTLTFFMSAFVLRAQDAALDETDVQATYKASYLFNFAKYCDWPEEYKKVDFVIAVAGNSGVLKELQDKYKGKRIGNQVIDVKELKLNEKVGYPVHILYVGRSASKDLLSYIKTFKKFPTMIVSEQDTALDSGSFINFKAVDSVIKFEINDTRAKEAGVLIGDILKGWALNIK